MSQQITHPVKEKMRLAIVGSREMKDSALFNKVINEFIAKNGAPIAIVSGGASGADSLAEKYACLNKIPTIIQEMDKINLEISNSSSS